MPTPSTAPWPSTAGWRRLNVGTWPDTGLEPEMTDQTAKDLIDWCYAA